MVLYRSSNPHFVEVGKLPETINYRNVKRFPEAELKKDVLVVRFDEQLYFANAGYFQDRLKNMAKKKGNVLELIIIDCSSIHDMDSTGMEALKEVYTFFQKNNVKIYFTGVVGPVRDFMKKAGLFRIIGEKNYFLRIHEAMVFHDSDSEQESNAGWHLSLIHI